MHEAAKWTSVGALGTPVQHCLYHILSILSLRVFFIFPGVTVSHFQTERKPEESVDLQLKCILLCVCDISSIWLLNQSEREEPFIVDVLIPKGFYQWLYLFSQIYSRRSEILVDYCYSLSCWWWTIFVKISFLSLRLSKGQRKITGLSLSSNLGLQILWALFMPILLVSSWFNSLLKILVDTGIISLSVTDSGTVNCVFLTCRVLFAWYIRIQSHIQCWAISEHKSSRDCTLIEICLLSSLSLEMSFTDCENSLNKFPMQSVDGKTLMYSLGSSVSCILSSYFLSDQLDAEMPWSLILSFLELLRSLASWEVSNVSLLLGFSKSLVLLCICVLFPCSLLLLHCDFTILYLFMWQHRSVSSKLDHICFSFLFIHLHQSIVINYIIYWRDTCSKV